MKKWTTSHECHVKRTLVYYGSTAVNRRAVVYDISQQWRYCHSVRGLLAAPIGFWLGLTCPTKTRCRQLLGHILMKYY